MEPYLLAAIIIIGTTLIVLQLIKIIGLTKVFNIKAKKLHFKIKRLSPDSYEDYNELNNDLLSLYTECIHRLNYRKISKLSMEIQDKYSNLLSRIEKDNRSTGIQIIENKLAE